MADETKTYLVNIESNIKQYADDAARAKKEVDDLTIANKKLKESGASPAEIEASNAALKNKNDEYRKAASLLKTAIAYTQSETGSRKQLSEQLKLQEQALGKLKNAYIVDANGVRTLNPLYVEQRKQIAATKQAILDYDKSLNDGRSNVGRYGESVKAAFADAGKSVLSMVSPMALIAAGMALASKIAGELKEALLSTAKAMDTLNTYTMIWKQMMYDFVTTGKTSIKTMNEVALAAKLMNDERRGDRKDMVEFALLERQIAMAEFDAADKTKTLTERMDALNKAIALQNELSDKKLADAREDLRILNILIKARPEDDKLRQQEAELIVRIINLDKERYDQNKRNEGRATGMEKTELDARKKMMEGWFEEIDAMNKKQDEDEVKAAKEKEEKIKKIQEDYAKKHHDQEILAFNEATKFIDEEIKRMESVADIKFKGELDLGKALFNQNQKNAKAIWDAMLDADKKEIEQAKKKEDVKQKLIQAGIQGAQAGADAIFQMQTNRLNAQMTAELSNANLTASERTAISKKYYKEQQKMAVTQAIINGALGVVSSLTGPPVIKWIEAAAVAVATLAQIAVIKSQSFDGGGGGSGTPTAITTSPPAQRATSIPVGSSIINPQLSQGQVNAIPNSNPLTAADIAEIIKNMPAPIVTVQDINKVQANKNKVEVRANI